MPRSPSSPAAESLARALHNPLRGRARSRRGRPRDGAFGGAFGGTFDRPVDTTRTWLGAGCLVLLLGCNAPAPSTQAPVDLPATTARPAPTNERPAPGAAPTDDPIAALERADTPAARAAVERLQGLAQLLTDTKTAAREAAEAETTPCRRAFASNVAARRVSAELAARHAIPLPAWEVLAEADYLAACETLPTELRECARYDTRIDARERCAATETAADEATRVRYRTLVPPRQ